MKPFKDLKTMLKIELVFVKEDASSRKLKITTAIQGLVKKL